MTAPYITVFLDLLILFWNLDTAVITIPLYPTRYPYFHNQFTPLTLVAFALHYQTHHQRPRPNHRVLAVAPFRVGRE